MKVLFDTTALIHMIKGDQGLREVVGGLKDNSVFYTSTINIYEVKRGIYQLERDREKRIASFAALVDNISVLFVDIPAAEYAARIYAELQRKGITIDEHDYLIAGICISNGIDTIVTKNEKHFKEIRELKVVTY